MLKLFFFVFGLFVLTCALRKKEKELMGEILKYTLFFHEDEQFKYSLGFQVDVLRDLYIQVRAQRPWAPDPCSYRNIIGHPSQ